MQKSSQVIRKVASINKIKHDLGYGNKEKKPEILTLSNYLEGKYFPYLRTNRAPRSLETYKRSLDMFFHNRDVPMSIKAFLIIKIFENVLKVKRNKHAELWY